MERFSKGDAPQFAPVMPASIDASQSTENTAPTQSLIRHEPVTIASFVEQRVDTVLPEWMMNDPTCRRMSAVLDYLFGDTHPAQTEGKQGPATHELSKAVARKSSDAQPKVVQDKTAQDSHPLKDAFLKREQRNSFVADPRRDSERRISGHKANFGPKDSISIEYIDGKSNTVKRINFGSSIVERETDGSYSERNIGTNDREKLQSVKVDQSSGDIAIKYSDGHSAIYKPGGGTVRLDKNNQIESMFVPDNSGATMGEVWLRNGEGVLTSHVFERD